jgi:DNA-binding LacI/PurR family transcriptional regulator
MATITIKDVARKAGVSISTASRVFNDIPHSLEVGKRVKAAAKILSYQPNGIARAFRSQQTNIIGLCILKDPEQLDKSDMLNMFSLRVIEGVESFLLENGYNVLVSSITQQNIENMEMPQIVSQGLIDGLILYEIRDNRYCSAVRKVMPKLVAADHFQTDIPTVRIASYEGGQIAASHLLERGHRDVAVIMAKTSFNAQNFTDRLAGFKSVIKADMPVLYVNPWERGDCPAVESLLSSGEKFTAIFCGNDQMAIRTIKSLTKKGIKVPEEVSVIGFDDIELSRHISPSLTTIAVDKRMIGEESARLVLRMIENSNLLPLQIKIPVSLVERETVAKIN